MVKHKPHHMACPDCKGTKPIMDSPSGDYCTGCGLILGTYKPIPRQLHNSRKKNKRNRLVRKGLYCKGCSTTENLTLHHIIPKRAGGKKTIVLCRYCHNIADRLADSLYPKQLAIIEKSV